MNEPLYPEDTLSTAPERFFASEIIREKIFLLYGREVPYSAEVVVDEFREQHENDPKRKDLIRCSIIVERDTQKQIIIGHKGQALKKLGQTARQEIEQLLGRPVFLELFVKVRPDWRKKTDPPQILRLLAAPWGTLKTENPPEYGGFSVVSREAGKGSGLCLIALLLG